MAPMSVPVGVYVEAKGYHRGAMVGTYRRPRKGHMVTVLLPGLVEALGKLLEESM